MRRTLGLVAATAAVIGVALWWTRVGTVRTDGAPAPDELATVSAAAPKIVLRPLPDVRPGSPLFDPIVVGPCHLVPWHEQDVASQVEGLLKDVRVDLGQAVNVNDVLAELDDRLLTPQVELLRIKAESVSAQGIAKAQLGDLDKKLATAKNLVAKRAMPREEYESLQYQRERFVEEAKRAEEEQRMAGQELVKAKQALDLHRIRSGMTGEVTRVYKRSGESVRPAEPLFSVARLDRLRVEGVCKVQQAALLRPGMRAALEPELRGEPMTALSGHTAPITSLAMNADGRLLASASEDQTVRLWSCATKTALATLRHPAEVYALAFVPQATMAAESRVERLLTGSSDGQLRSWTLAAGSTEPTVWAGSHEAAVRALACSADGRWCATGGEDRRIGIWDTTSGQLVYWVHGGGEAAEFAHRGAVTTVHFTPDGHLVSAGRDNLLKVWELGNSSAKLVGELPGRTGDATQLGLSPEGRRILFDHGDELRIVDWSDGSTLGTLRSRRQGRFQAFAAFAPSGRLILSAGGNGQLQLWTAPTPADQASFFRQGYGQSFRRDAFTPLLNLGSPSLAVAATGTPQLWPLDGYELRHFATANPAAVTCGVFAPDESVVYSAGSDKRIYVWAVPPVEQPLEAVVTYVGSQVERGTDLVRVRAELANPTDPNRRLRPGTYANLRFYPETAPKN